MGKFHGKVGYVSVSEGESGIWTESVTERSYYGDELKITRKLMNAESTNDDFSVNNEISILADPYALQYFHAIRYVEWLGSRWKVTRVTVNRPRLILSIGGVYNGISGPTP